MVFCMSRHTASAQTTWRFGVKHSEMVELLEGNNTPPPPRHMHTTLSHVESKTSAEQSGMQRRDWKENRKGKGPHGRRVRDRKQLSDIAFAKQPSCNFSKKIPKVHYYLQKNLSLLKMARKVFCCCCFFTIKFPDLWRSWVGE